MGVKLPVLPPVAFVRNRRPETGIALVMTAISMMVLSLCVALAVDLGNWYLQAQKLQRASDSAALAVAASLPSASAADQAEVAAKKNGFPPGGDVELNVNVSGDRATVSLKHKKISAYFLRGLFPSIAISRESTAQKSAAVSLGSPYNVLGSGDLTLPKKGGGTFRSNTWLAINGPCTAREDGDYFNSLYNGNKGLNKTSCPGGTPNPSYDGNGYSYFVEVPGANTSAVNLRIYDPLYWPPEYWSHPDDPKGPDIDIIRPLDSQGCIDTMFQVWRVNSDGSETNVKRISYGCYSEVYPASWETIYTIPASSAGITREYRIQVSTWDPAKAGELPDNGWGANAFSIMAASGGSNEVCDSRTDPTCPKVFGKTAVSLLNSFTGSEATNKALVPLAEIPDVFAGSSVSLSIFDPGEGVQSIEVLQPNGSLATFNWKSYPQDVIYQGTGVTSISTGGLGPKVNPGDAPAPGTNYKFNNRRIVMEIPIPAGSASWLGPGGDSWWQIQYTMAPGSTPPPDRTTWGAELGGHGPAHLVRN